MIAPNAVAAETGNTIPQIALNWLLQNIGAAAERSASVPPGGAMPLHVDPAQLEFALGLQQRDRGARFMLAQGFELPGVSVGEFLPMPKGGAHGLGFDIHVRPFPNATAALPGRAVRRVRILLIP